MQHQGSIPAHYEDQRQEIRGGDTTTDRRTRTLIWLVIAFVVAVAALAIIGALTWSGTDNGYGMMGGGDWGWAMALMVVPAILLILIIVYAIVGVEERPAYNTQPVYVQPQPSPLEILNQRYARGEISNEEYERIRSQLGR